MPCLSFLGVSMGGKKSTLSSTVTASLSKALHFSLVFFFYLSLCVCVSCAEVSSVPGQSSSFSSETGAAHPDGPPSQPHALHRSQVTNGNRLQLCVTDALALISFCFHLMPQLPSAVTLQRTFIYFFVVVKCQVKAVCSHYSCMENEDCFTLAGRR